MTQNTHRWQRITNLPENWREFGNDNLRSLSDAWKKQKDDLEPALQKNFLEKLQRQWAIETGLIENLYVLDRGITRTLVEQGLDAIEIPHNATNKQPGYVKRLIEDQQAVVEGLLDFVGRTRELSTSYIKELHAQLTRTQDKTEAVDSAGRYVEVDLLKGEWKKLPNNPTRPDGKSIHEYCPPEHVAAEMDQLIVWHMEHMKEGVLPEVEAAWLHHRFTQIHPFQDGNGRVARALATLVFLKAEWFPLVVLNDDRMTYIDALEQADAGDLQPLMRFFASLAENNLSLALNLNKSIVEVENMKKEVFCALKQKLAEQKKMQLQNQKAIEYSQVIYENAQVIFEKTVNDTMEIIKTYENDKYFINTSVSDDFDEIKKIINKLTGVNSPEVYGSENHKHVSILFFKNTILEYKIIFLVRTILKKDERFGRTQIFYIAEAQNKSLFNVAHGNEEFAEPFMFTGADSLAVTLPRFEIWLQKGLNKGLTLWQQTL